MSHDGSKGQKPSYIGQRQVGPYLFTLIAPGEENGHWPWVVNRTDGKDPHSSFGKTVAEGRARSQEEAMRQLEAAFKDQAQIIEDKVRERILELEDAHFEILGRLALVAEYREDDTGEHTKRVGQGAAFLTRALGLPEDQVILIRDAAPLHDLGKIAIPDHILLKPGQLTPEEFGVMKSHTMIGAKILSGGRNPIVQMAEGIALTHHEHWDGTGYPQGLRGDAIPLTGRIVAIVDVFDALTHMRPYRRSWPAEQALAELQRCAGTHFDPWCVDAFLTLRADMLACSLLGLRPKGNR